MAIKGRKDYKITLVMAYVQHNKDYLYGYIQCLRTHEIVTLSKALELVHLVESLPKKQIKGGGKVNE